MKGTTVGNINVPKMKKAGYMIIIYNMVIVVYMKMNSEIPLDISLKISGINLLIP